MAMLVVPRPLADAPLELIETVASLGDDVSARFRGHVDRVEISVGVEGWVIDLDHTERAVVVQIMVDMEIVAEATSGLPRPDIATLVDPLARPGFYFPPEALLGLLDLDAEERKARLAVRVQNTPYVLPSRRKLPRVGDLANALEALSAPAGSGKPAGKQVFLQLEELRVAAANLIGAPFRPIPEKQVGFLEVASIGGGGQIWVAGWLLRSQPLLGQAVVVDGKKFPASIMLTGHDRPDLPAAAQGVFGVMATEWRPGSNSNALVYLGRGSGFYMRANKPLRTIPPAEFAALFAAHLPNCVGEHTNALQRLLTGPTSWMPSLDGGTGVGIRIDIDRVLIAPHFGCFVEGWLLSPLHQVETLMMRLGERVLEADPAATYFKPRPDLAGILPNSEALLQRAGFVACFPGPVTDEDLAQPLLKVVFADGTSTTLAIRTELLRRIGISATVDELATLYPALYGEAFFPGLAQALALDVRLRSTSPVPFAVAPAPRAMVFAVSAERHDALLLFDSIARRWRSGGSLPGLVLLAGRSQGHRADLVELVRELEQLPGAAVSLFFISDDPAQLPASLVGALQLLRVRRFLYVPAGVVPDSVGWPMAFDLLTAAIDRLDLVPLPGAVGTAPETLMALHDQCFASSRSALTLYLRRHELRGPPPLAIALDADARPFGRRARLPGQALAARWLRQADFSTA
jgi:hypothetical protein